MIERNGAVNYLLDGIQIAGANIAEKLFWFLKNKLSDFMTDTIIFDSTLNNGVLKWVKNNCQPIPLISNTKIHEIEAINVVLKETEEQKLVPIEVNTNSSDSYLLYKGIPIWINFYSQKQISFIRGTIDKETLIREVVEEHSNILNNQSKRFRVIRYDSDDESEEGRGRAGSTNLAVGTIIGDYGEISEVNNSYDVLSGIYQSEGIKQLLQDAENWKNNRHWYKKKKVPWRRGWLLYGKPGNGKSTICKAVAQHIDIPINIFDIGDMDNRDFVYHWEKAKQMSPVMILIEDIDGVFNGRENVKKDKDSLTFNTLLNCISGVENNDGVLLVVTTNNPDAIDGALGKPVPGTTISTRPGRLDRAIEVLPPDIEAKRWLVNNLLPAFDSKLIEDTEDYSYSQFVEKCRNEAMRLALLELK